MPINTKILAAGGLIAAALSSPAFAAGTAANTKIDNTASVSYSVGGVAQTPATSNTASFFVDRRVSMTLTEPGNATTSVVPNSSNQVTTFLLTNTSNAALDFGLALAQPAAA